MKLLRINSPQAPDRNHRISQTLQDWGDKAWAQTQLLKHPFWAISSASFGALALLVIIFGSFAGNPSGPTKTKFDHREILTTTREIILEPTRELGKETYPVGTPVRILDGKGSGEKIKFLILVGESKEQTWVTWQAITEAGGTAGEPIQVMSIQPPNHLSIVNHDGPAGFIPTGQATGDEDIAPMDPELEQEVFRLINVERTSRGLRALEWDPAMARGARYTAVDYYVQGYYTPENHMTRDVIYRNGKIEGFTFVETAQHRAQKFSSKTKGENGASSNNKTKIGLAKGNGDPAKAFVVGWMNSPSHRQFILEPNHRYGAIGYWGSKSEWGRSTCIFWAGH